MKFRFCGDLDAPDWLLAEISLLSKLPTIRLKLLLKQLIVHIVEGQIDVEKVLKQTKSIFGNETEIQGLIVALEFILKSAARFNIDHSVLLKEILQLGLQKENGDIIAKLYKENRQSIRSKLEEESFKLPKVLTIDWRTDYILAEGGVNLEKKDDNLGTDADKMINEAEVQLKLRIQKDIKTKVKEDITLSFDSEKFQVFYHELVKAKEMMDSTEAN